MKTLEQLQQEHSEMCATAADLGLSLPKELTVEFTTVDDGVRITGEIDAMIKKFREGVDEPVIEAPTPPAGKKPVASRNKKGQGASASSKPTGKSGGKTGEGEPPVAKKAVKKASAKKTAKKAVAKKAGAAKEPSTRSKFEDTATVTWIAKENPCRAGSGRHERYEKLRKASGKTVKAVLAMGVPSATLGNASAAKIIKIA